MSFYDEAREVNALRERQENVPFRDGVLSMKANSFTYCTPKDNSGVYTHVEVAYIHGNGNFLKINELEKYDTGDGVYPQVPLNDILMILKKEMLLNVHNQIEVIKGRYNKPLEKGE
tara:strand:+ start:44 stop:391 length:348 start_codon:yes stop_codon:yes gene_type:complete